MGFGLPDLPDVTPDFVDDGVNAVVDAGGYALDKAGDGLSDLASFAEKTVSGAWDIVEDGFEIVMAEVRRVMQWLWDKVPDFIMNPAGNPAPLREAAAAWRAIADDIDQTRNDLLAAGRALGEWKGPAADRFDTYLNGLLERSGQLVDGIESIAKMLSDAAKALDDLNRLVHTVAAEIAAYIVVSVVLGLITLGIGTAAGAAQVALLVARVTAAIRKAVLVVQRLLPVLAEANTLRALTWATFKVDDMISLGRLAKTTDTALKWGSTAAGNAIAVSVASGKDPSKWGKEELLTFGLGTVVSVNVANRLKPILERTKRGPHGVVAAGVTSSASSSVTNVGVQLATTGSIDPKMVGVSAATGFIGGSASRSATLAARGQGLRGKPLGQDRFDPKAKEKATHIRVSETDKSGGRIVDGGIKGETRKPFAPRPPFDAPGGRPVVDAVPKSPFGRPTYVVRPGDDLTTIATALLGDGDRWPELVNGASPAVSDPDLIQPGQTITLPR